jgi:cytochrome P450
MSDIKPDTDTSQNSGCPFGHGAPMRYPQPRQTPFDPPRQYRDAGPIQRIEQWTGAQAWLITSYADIRRLLLDPRISSDATNPSYPAQNAALRYIRSNYHNFSQMDPPGHTDERKLFVSEFSVRRVEGLKPAIQSIADELIEKMKATGGADLVRDFAGPLPCSTICTVLGVPQEDHAKLQQWSKKISLLSITHEQAVEMMDEFERYITQLIAWKDANPGDDLLSRLIVNHLRTGTVTHHKVVSFARVFLIAGHETTTNTLSVGMAALLYHPEQWEMLLKDHSLVDSAVEEILRYCDVTHSGRLRVAKEDIEFGDVLIKSGDAIILHQPTADRDESVFERPDVFDITRNPRNHLAFSTGIHHCIGHPLARAELRIGLRSLIEAFPGLRPVLPLEELNFEHHLAIYGLESLPVSF